jgi:hypothetical protein
MKITTLILILLTSSACSTVQYNYTPTSINYQFIRYGIKEQSIVVVLPLIQDNTKKKGSRTILDTRIDITTSSITGTGSNKNIRYVMPNGFILGFKYKF